MGLVNSVGMADRRHKRLVFSLVPGASPYRACPTAFLRAE
jgi:hypothetical protein